MAYGSRRYVCPDCGQPTNRSDPHNRKLGLFIAHVGCRPTCPFCEKTLEEPTVGHMDEIVAWCGKPAHGACKQRHYQETRPGTPPGRTVTVIELPEEQ